MVVRSRECRGKKVAFRVTNSSFENTLVFSSISTGTPSTVGYTVAQASLAHASPDGCSRRPDRHAGQRSELRRRPLMRPSPAGGSPSDFGRRFIVLCD